MPSEEKGIARGQVEAVFRAMRAQHVKMGEQLDAFEALLLESATPGAIAKKWLVDTFGALWRGRYATAFIPTWQRDIATVKRLLAQLDVDQLTARANWFFRDSDPFLTQARHPIGLFATNINRYAEAPADNDAVLVAPPIGCTHRPQCRSDVAHTRRVGQELRAS